MEWNMIQCWALQEDYATMDSPGCEFLWTQVMNIQFPQKTENLWPRKAIISSSTSHLHKVKFSYMEWTLVCFKFKVTCHIIMHSLYLLWEIFSIWAQELYLVYYLSSYYTFKCSWLTDVLEMPEISIQNFTVLQTRLYTGTQEFTLPHVKTCFLAHQ